MFCEEVTREIYATGYTFLGGPEPRPLQLSPKCIWANFARKR